jgi:hypothetical protein
VHVPRIILFTTPFTPQHSCVISQQLATLATFTSFYPAYSFISSLITVHTPACHRPH